MFASLVPVVYVQISAEKLVVRDVKSGQTISETPEVAISATTPKKILGVGASARSHASSTVVNPFAHPRSLVSDFTVGEQLLKEFIRRLLSRSLFAISPFIVMHPLGKPAGGFTQVEIRAFHEMARGAGASRVLVWEGRTLSDQELLAGNFSGGGQVLS